MSPEASADAPLSLNPNEADGSTSGKVIAAVIAKKEPPPESKEAIWTRRLVILSFWAVIILVGLPVWWKTTAIYRADLPLQIMTDWADGKVRTFHLSLETTTNNACALDLSSCISTAHCRRSSCTAIPRCPASSSDHSTCT